MSDEIIIESIKKLMSLKMKDDEIIGSLMDAGVDYDYAKKMLDYVKYKKPLEKKKEKKEQKKEIIKKEEIANIDKKSLDVWQEGVLTIINQKLDEINEKEKNIEKEISEKVQTITSAELKKMKVILDSQRTLLITKINSTLDQKLKEIDEKLNNEIKTIQEINKETQNKLEEINEGKEKLKELQESLTNLMEEFSKLRDNAKNVIEQMKKDFETQTNALLKEYENKFKEVNNKLNSALNLASKILDGLVTATKKKLDNYYDKKAEEAIKEIKEKISQPTINIEEEIKKIKGEIDNKIAVAIEDALSRQKTKNYDESIMDLNKRLAELERKLHKTGNELPQDLEEKLEELLTFKEQYARLVAKLMKEIKELKKK